MIINEQIIIIVVIALLLLISPWIVAKLNKLFKKRYTQNDGSYKASSRKHHNETFRQEDYFDINYSPKVEALYGRVKQIHQEHIVLKDDFIIDNEYYTSIAPGKYVTDSINKLAIEIFFYLELIPIDVMVLYEWEDRYSEKKEEAGYYRSKGPGRDIHVKVKKDYNCSDIAAILCHEITHYYMDVKNINYSDVQENEEATDMMAILLGFGPILINGYVNHRTVQSYGNQTITHTSKIGYLTSDDCRVVYRIVNFLKQKVEKEKADKQQLESSRKEIEKKLYVAVHLYEQLEFVLKNLDVESPSVEDILKLQELYHKMEAEYFTTRLNKLKNYKIETVAEAKDILQAIDEFCAEIAMYNAIIGKY